MLKIFKYIKPREWLFAGLCVIFVVAQVFLDLKIPDYMAQITMLINTSHDAVGEVLRTGCRMLLCALGSITSAVIVCLFASKIGARFAERLRALLFDKVEAFSMSEINRFSTSSLITRSTNDITNVQMLVVMGLQIIIKAPIMAVWAVVKIAGKGYEWTMATVCGVFLLLIMVTLMMIFVIPKFKRMQTLTDNITRVTRENLTGLRVVRAYNAENYQEEKFERANSELTYTQLFTTRAMVMLMPFMQTIMGGLSLSIYWLGAYMIEAAGGYDKLLLFSDMVVFSQYAMQVIMAFMLLAIIFIMLPRAGVSARRINEALDTELCIKDGTETSGLTGITGEVEFKNVSFKYEGGADYVLRDISFTARKGETVALIGSTGSGKTTLVNLIPRFYDVTEGRVLVDGVDVRDYKLSSLLGKIGYVPQKAVLFKGTVDSNVQYGDNSGDVSASLNIAEAAEFAADIEEVAQGGANISGGQRQRLSIARAVCRRPEIYIFDDSFSALDYKTDRTVRSKLKSTASDITNIIVAQRIGTIIDADQIIVLDEGEIVGKGRHRELLRDCAVYKEIAQSQLSEEELAS